MQFVGAIDPFFRFYVVGKGDGENYKHTDRQPKAGVESGRFLVDTLHRIFSVALFLPAYVSTLILPDE